MPADRDDPGVHGALVWYRDVEALERSIAAIAEQTQPLASLTIVDNRGNRRDTAERVAASFGAPVTYLDPGDNVGPAGGYRIAMDDIVQRAEPSDWIVLLDDDDVEGKPHELLAELVEFAEQAVARDPTVGCVGRKGMRLDRRLGVFVPVPYRDTMGEEVDVDGVANGLLPLYRVGAVRLLDGFRSELFFGHEELDVGLRLKGHGFRIVAWAPRFGDGFRTMRGAVRQRPSVSSDNAWRRYYSRRNLLVILRSNGLWAAFAFQLVVAPVISLARLALFSPRLVPGHAAVLGRATADAVRGRLGRVVDPPERL